MNSKNNCMLCGAPLVYFERERELSCALCGKTFSGAAMCEKGHYVCDDCHAKIAYQEIYKLALEVDSPDPLGIALKMMALASVHMHGPEHHFLVPAALLSAFCRAGGPLPQGLEEALKAALERAKNVPGGACGFWGCCGAGVGAGIFFSVATGATPLAQKSWALSNAATSAALQAISAHGGPRCCKRDSFLSLLCAARLANEQLGSSMVLRENLRCGYSAFNEQCLQENCPFNPQHVKK
jgi:hypothetical protein